MVGVGEKVLLAFIISKMVSVKTQESGLLSSSIFLSTVWSVTVTKYLVPVVSCFLLFAC